MEEQLQRIRSWARRGTLKQFCTEASARLAVHGYTAELSGDVATFYRQREEKAGLLGVKKRQIREPVLTLVRHDSRVDIPVEAADPAFVDLLAGVLRDR
jgi:hypothetical protein